MDTDKGHQSLNANINMIYDKNYLRTVKHNPFYISTNLEAQSRREVKESIALAVCIASIGAAAWLVLWLVGAF